MENAIGEGAQEYLNHLENYLRQFGEKEREAKQKIESARTKAICRAGYGNLDSLHVERVLRENAKKP